MSALDATLQVNHVCAGKAQGHRASFMQFAERLNGASSERNLVLRAAMPLTPSAHPPDFVWHEPCRALNETKIFHQHATMNISYADDCRIETRFVWARCAAENARALRDLIKAFQSDGWDGGRENTIRRKHSRRSSNK